MNHITPEQATELAVSLPSNLSSSAFMHSLCNAAIQHYIDSAAPAQTIGGWLPIESAPKDGTRVLLFFPVFGNAPRQESGSWGLHKYNKVVVPCWVSDCERIYGVIWHKAYQPTHWMPLPAAPTGNSIASYNFEYNI
jgi:hypothetical protein